MTEPHFFKRSSALTLAKIASVVETELPSGADADLEITDIAPISEAQSGHITFLDNPKYVAELAETKASVILCSKRYVAKVPEGVVALEVKNPYHAFAKVSALFYPQAMAPMPFFGEEGGISQAAHIHPTANIEANVCIEPGASVGAGAEIGAGTVIGVNAVIGQGVRIGRDCHIGANVVLQHTLIGDKVILHPGVCSGQDGFGFAMSPMGHSKVPQVGRVIIQDNVEIGANSTIDRGANKDTVIGEGTKIDNQVQIGHNVEVGRHCVIVSQVGISGSSVLEDFVAIGGQSGVAGHIKIGMGAQIAAVSVARDDIPAGGRYGGVPAKPVRQWFREMAALKKLAEKE
ncbi:MAG: UDP-3-O-(3-hydroxymyristoyl)glucosamine N-acyltransferase [Cohaesibacter sp.]|jgi:UDP-3-O-[3-hydroxymyristoyl] glucosamine N-acyltransferase|nr:UDP-3-O-(3-hydroxymyristoyl)glucosamine N-acyltransferase [Cohaesibacter sp.]